MLNKYAYAVDQRCSYIQPGTPQDQAVGLSMSMFSALLRVCSSFSQNFLEEGGQEEGSGNHDNHSTLSLLRQYLPAVKVWMDWMLQHVALWQTSSVWYV